MSAEDFEQPVSADMDPSSPAPVEQETSASPEAATTQPEPASAPVASVAEQPVAQQPEAAAAPPTPAQVQQDLDQEAYNLHQDFSNGHIKPETYRSMYGKKDTLGKMNTFLGLLFSGAGSGLSHQPNALMDMMNKELDRDLDAQKASQTNAQNWLKMAQDYHVQKAQIKHTEAGAKLLTAQAEAYPSEVQLRKSQIKNMDVNTAKTGMLLGFLKDANNAVANMPDGPAKIDNQAKVDNLLAPAIAGKIKEGNAAVAQEAAATEDTGVDTKKLKLLKTLGAGAAAAGGPGLKGMDTGEVTRANVEAEKVQDNRAIAGLYDRAFKKLDSMALAGKLTPGARSALISSLGAEVARATAGRYNEKEALAQADGMFPQPGDLPSTRKEKYGSSMEFFHSREKGTPTLNTYGLKTPWPYEEKKTAFQEGQTGKMGSIPVIYKNGKWVKK